MDIIIATNLDMYKPVNWPKLSFPPHVGEYVQVAEISRAYCRSAKIPDNLIVQRVEHCDGYIKVDVWYSPFQVSVGDKRILMGQ